MPKPSLNQGRSTGAQLEGYSTAVPCLGFQLLSLLLGFFLTLPIRGSSAPPKTQHIKLEMFCETLSSFGEREGDPQGTRSSVPEFPKQPFPFPVTFCPVILHIFNAKQNCS